MSHLFTLLFFCILIANCTSPSKPIVKEKYTLSVYTRYDDAEGIMSAEAVMKKGDASQPPIELKEGMSFQKRNMVVRPVSGLTYTAAYNASHVEKPLFEWNDPTGKLMHFNASLPNISTFGFGSNEVSCKAAAKFTWEGPILSKGETFVLMWENPKKNLTVPMEVYTLGEQDFIDFPAAKMKELSPGNWALYVVRKKLERTTVEDVTIESITEYYTKPIKIVVK